MPLNVLDQKFLDSQLVTALQKKNLVSGEEIAAWRARGSASDDLKSLVMTKHVINEEDWVRLLGDVWGIPYKDLTGLVTPPSVLQAITESAAKNYHMVAFERSGKDLSVGLVKPHDVAALEVLEFLSKEHNWRIRYFIISEASFQAAVRQYHTLSKEIESVLTQAEEKFADVVATEQEEVDEVVKRAPVAKIVSVIIQHAVEGKASDIHIEPLMRESRVRYRIDGILHISLLLPKYIHNAVVSRIKVLSNLKLDETRLPQDGRIRLNVEGRDVDLRISVLPLADGEKVVMRVLDASVTPPTLADLGFRDDTRAVIEKSIKRPHGLFLVTGPTGSGKSTTLFAVLNLLNREGVNIITLEDPIEYYVKGVNQSQVRPEIGYTFANGLRSILRQDPDVVMVGEIRDNETAELSIHAGLTGHYVLSTLHTNDALGAVPRMLDMKVEPFLMVSTLDTIVAQRLVRKLCPDCQAPVENVKQLIEIVIAEFTSLSAELRPTIAPDTKLYHSVGCAKCSNTGYRGRLAIAEAITMTPEMQQVVMGGNKPEEVKAELKRQKFFNMRQDGMLKVLQGMTSIEEVIRVTTD
ncbi:hypothetical protein A3H10_01805 [Candidatus Uhrbacteria bacterium RIFCSPLOWO2_12_FULL_46_10]|uniref:Bacterial type II secretion system protein E domain-containing protein n=1 Tax=Candidatus Uhrbacteria bacterium RIFCSPLOWO2_01_FULL_47_25 TaxID=1802402 RepID=A0A1F7USX2_9BACT|nr:MAG: Type 4 fimbrial assembly protein PilB [Parcubacteria group bacterium GW2011_GWA2_46_9]OGL60743.1 MAG: hypothetical protein A2752_03325 [Candidatus Uhrbacteria bacterium RIFCSPHIGHO2_01_FULL_46_23]OGL69543.1 MAG: hypothetical protein A3D60_00890 [Candidatus Uhrbacteria bacterium RIFCSPHIGHO2_02_FULL_47_29]OGL76005.1 MAG: hypothetical protein A3E96_02110 [Candidatus Uhrbacteria bacterium RIFCSPHIGHO2_12_FULL_46_13]OGL81403.1 MAG: hypothetical protein A2936_00210 [Candidatus Uhrbacteria ba